MDQKQDVQQLASTLLLVVIAIAASMLTYSWVMSMVGSQAGYAIPIKEFNCTLFDPENNLGVLGDVVTVHFILENPSNITVNYSVTLIAPINNYVQNETFSIYKNGVHEQNISIMLNDIGVWKMKITNKNTGRSFEKPFVVMSTRSDAQIAASAYSNQLKSLKLSEDANTFSKIAILISIIALIPIIYKGTKWVIKARVRSKVIKRLR